MIGGSKLTVQEDSDFNLKKMTEPLHFTTSTIRKETLEKVMKEIETIRSFKLIAEIEPNYVYRRD
jgi:hypothetical protein